MSRLDFARLGGEKSVPVTRTFTHPDLPEPLTLTLRPVSDTDRWAVYDDAAELNQRLSATPPVMQNGEAVTVSESLCRAVATLMRAQVAIEGERAYTAEEWLMLAHGCDPVFDAVYSAAISAGREGKSPVKAVASVTASGGSPSSTP